MAGGAEGDGQYGPVRQPFRPGVRPGFRNRGRLRDGGVHGAQELRGSPPRHARAGDGLGEDDTYILYSSFYTGTVSLGRRVCFALVFGTLAFYLPALV